MNKIVSDLQDYARPVRPQLVESDLQQLVEDTLSSISVPENVEVTLDLEDVQGVMVDPTLMKRVFTNLIINALQSMPKGGRLTVGASMADGAVCISFQDTGLGMPKENVDKLFRPLFTTKSKGQGLGLPVCKRLVEAHGGTISVRSEVGVGSTFTVQIPLKRR